MRFENHQHSMFLDPVSPDEVLKTISSLKNSSSGFDMVDTRVIKFVSTELAVPLSTLCNESFRVGFFPKELKVARVIPIYKNGDATIFSNYRPVSVLTVFSKIYERLMHHRLSHYLKTNNILFENPFNNSLNDENLFK